MLSMVLMNTATEKSGDTRFEAAIAVSPKIFPMIMVSERSIRYSIPIDTDAVSKRVLNLHEQKFFILQFLFFVALHSPLDRY